MHRKREKGWKKRSVWEVKKEEKRDRRKEGRKEWRMRNVCKKGSEGIEKGSVE